SDGRLAVARSARSLKDRAGINPLSWAAVRFRRGAHGMPRAPERSGRAAGPWRSSDDETVSASAVGRMKRGAWIVAVITSGCVVDLAERCGPHQELVANNVCTCVAGSVLAAAGCVPCGPAEEASAGGPASAPGWASPAPAPECAPAGIGAP